ncbi:MAG: PHP domain-containing protein [Candidatus Cloacimonetes bacterium]|nr:PHP domain-containing protein [Candidatus Cloacimonadota bacterium]
MSKTDLHVHTNYSDGLLSVKELLSLAQERDIGTLAITDHDTIDGFLEASGIASQYGIKLIPGVEISSLYKGRDIHILAYNYDPCDKKVLNLLQSIQKGRFLRAKKILTKLLEYDIKIDFNEVRKLTGKNDLIGRPHIARVMVEQGFVHCKEEAFDYYIGDRAPAYAAKPAPSPKKVIKTIKKAGGLAVLAHPHIIKNDEIVMEMIEMGIQGLEVYYAKVDRDTVNHYEQIACECNLLRTGGTDFHGGDLDHELFGNYEIPDFVLEELESRVNCQRRG